MSKFTVGDLFKFLMNSCYRSPSRRSEDTAKKLEIQSRMHASKIKILEQHIHDLDLRKLTYVSQKKISLAKKVVLERHKVFLRKTRCEQLKDCCDRYLESITEFDIVNDTVGALNEAKTTFKHINIEQIGMKVGEISDVVADFRAELTQTQNAIGDMHGTDITDEELKAELDSLDSLLVDNADVENPSPQTINPPTNVSDADHSRVLDRDDSVHNMYKSTGVFA